MNETDFHLVLRQFGALLKKQRRAKGLTQKELAEQLSELGVQVSQGYISSLESLEAAHSSRTLRTPSLRLFLSLLSILDIPFEKLK
jgi:transcriptional regulator with XRE-family HTH domain